MARRKIAKEVCDNCGHQLMVNDHYCSHCGQDNHAPNQPIRHLLVDLFEAFTHLDHKVFQTFKNLFLHPGKCSLDYVENKRYRYVPPVRLYIFVSAVFFFLMQYFSVHALEHESIHFRTNSLSVNDGKSDPEGNASHQKNTLSVRESANPDSVKSLTAVDSVVKSEPQPIEEDTLAFSLRNTDIEISAGTVKYLLHSVEEKRDSVLLAHGEETSFMNRLLFKQALKSFDKKEDLLHIILTQAFKYFPILLFLMMPLFALLLKLIYIRMRRNYYEFLIISINYHTLCFLMYSIILLLMFIVAIPWWVVVIVVAGLFLHLVIGLISHFQQKVWKTIMKAAICCSLYGFVLLAGLVLSILIGWVSF